MHHSRRADDVTERKAVHQAVHSALPRSPRRPLADRFSLLVFALAAVGPCELANRRHPWLHWAKLGFTSLNGAPFLHLRYKNTSRPVSVIVFLSFCLSLRSLRPYRSQSFLYSSESNSTRYPYQPLGLDSHSFLCIHLRP